MMDVLPYYLLICLPVFIALSPINPVEAAQELDVHRLAQFDLASNSHGSRQAALSMDARGPRAGHVLRKTIVSKMCDLSVARFRELVTSGAGGFVLILPTNIASLTGQCREAILELEQELLSSEIDVPVYFTEVRSINQYMDIWRNFTNRQHISGDARVVGPVHQPGE